jgi:hypothetical protein
MDIIPIKCLCIYLILFNNYILFYYCRPQSDDVERSDLAKRFFIAGWERERGEGERESNSC